VDDALIRAAQRLLRRASRLDLAIDALAPAEIDIDENLAAIDDVSLAVGDLDDTGSDIAVETSLDAGSVASAPKTPVDESTPIIAFDELKVEDLSAGGSGPQGDEGMGNVPVALHSLPEDLRKAVPSEWAPPDVSNVDERYPLIPPFAEAHIYWKDDESIIFYEVIEPPLTDEEKRALERIKSLLLDLIDVSAYDLMKNADPEQYIRQKFYEIVDGYGFKLTQQQKDKLAYYVVRDFAGLERIEPLMRDPNLEDISCIGPGIPIYVYHRKYGSLKTNVMFPSAEELNRFIVKLAQMCGRHVSVANPLLEGALPDGSRVQATYAVTKDISTRGSTFTIRKFTKDPLTITDLINYGTIPPLLAAYLWLAIEHKQSILISGGTASGKTTLLNALSLFIPPEAKIVSIEDTPELRLPHEHWVQKIAREGTDGRGAVTMFDLLKAALRERPDYIVVGEVRGKEAYVLFQGMATGHPGLATIHAEDLDTLVDRLTTPPINLPASLLHALDIVLFMTRAKVRGIDVRRLREVHEVIGVDMKTKRPITNFFAHWIPGEDRFEFKSDKSYILDKIIKERGISPDSVWGELRRRAYVLKWMKEKNIRYYKDVGRIIARYYKEPEKLLEEIGYVEASSEDRI